MAYLSTQPYKGTRDYYPAEMRQLSYIFATWRSVMQRYGYEEYMTPLLEPIELYAAKTGQEIVNEQTYQFIDRGGRRVSIRPELTPSVSRMVAARRQELPYPLRWYNIASFMRYERPQRGREREFWQLNADIFGVEGSAADAEIITMADAIMKAFGASKKMYSVRINNRRIINYVMADYLSLDVVQAQLMIKLFDRKDKLPADEFAAQAAALFEPDQAAEGSRKIQKILSASTMADLPPEVLSHDAVQEVQALFTRLKQAGVETAVFDIGLMRGFDYYTGMVFEVFDNHPDNRRAMFGGGRYDGLVGLFGVEPVATVGMAPGATTTLDFLQSHGLMPELRPTTDLYMIVLGEAERGAHELAARLREEGVNVAVDITGRKLDRQIKSAVKLGVGYVLFVGDKELADQAYTLKDLVDGRESTVSYERVVTSVHDYRHRHSSSSEPLPEDEL